MRIAFAWHPAAWTIAEARWSIDQWAPLLDAPWRHRAPGAPAGSDEVVIFVGPQREAPADAAVTLDVDGWAPWAPATLTLADVHGVPLPCPDGACPLAQRRGVRAAPWLRGLAFLLSREEELRDPRRDQWNCYSGFYTRLHELGVLGRALVNRHAAALRAELDAACATRGSTLPREPRWPNGARLAAALSHDVDDVALHSLPQALRLLSQARSPGSYAVRGGLTALARALGALGRPDPYWNFERWVEAESRRGFRSTYYVFAPKPSRRHEYDALYAYDDTLRYEGRPITVRGLLHTLEARGCEVGLHGSYLSYRDADALARQKRQVEQGVGRAIATTRQHFLRFDRGATWSAQERAGFTCDATLGYNECPGFRAGIAAPFHPWNIEAGSSHMLLEVPLTLMDGALFRSLRLDADAAIAAIHEHLDEVEAGGGLASLLWHPNAAAEDMFPGWWRAYDATLDRLAARGAWATSTVEIERWWRERTARLTAA